MTQLREGLLGRGGRLGVRVAFLVVGAMLLADGARAQTVTVSGTTTAYPFREYATRELGDPWDMNTRTDMGWFTWGVDTPMPNMTNLGMGTDARGNTYFTGRPISGNGDPNFFLLDSWIPNATAKLGKIGVNYPIDTTLYNVLYIKMKFQGQVTFQQWNALGQGPPVQQVYWSRDTIHNIPVINPNGGSLRPVTAANGDAGLFFSPVTRGPLGGIEGGNWVIYRVPLRIADMKANNPVIDHWQNVFAGAASPDWGSAGVVADSLRFDPFQLPALADMLGEMQVDWARLVSESAGDATNIAWTGGGTFDVVVSPNPDCSDFAVLDYSRTSPVSFQAQVLPPGTYYFGLRAPFGQTGHSAGGGSTVAACGAQPVTVHSYPSLTFTSPNVEGSPDDFATTFLNNPWDFDSIWDIDYSRNANTPDATYGIVNMPATDPSGTDLGNVRVFRNLSSPGSAESGGYGDPYIFPMWPLLAQTDARAYRGLNNRIDASRYRILTTEVTIERTRTFDLGSVLRVMWHVAGDTKPDGSIAQIESAEIAFRHLDPATQNNGKIVLDTVQADMADRSTLLLEPKAPQSASGWGNTCVASAVSSCVTNTPNFKPGIDLFRLDFHEFANPTASAVKRIKLAALERTGSTFNLAWTGSDPSSLGATVTLKAVPVTNVAARNYRPVDPGCSSAASVPIASGIALGTGAWAWAPGATPGITNGAEYFICAQIFVPGIASPVDESMSRWPIVIDTGYTSPKPTLQLDRTTLRFAGVRTGQLPPNPVFTSKTPAQTVKFVQSGAGTVNWTVSVTDANGAVPNWLTVTPTSGTGGGTLTVDLTGSTSLAVCSAVDGLLATIKISSADSGNDPQYVQVFTTLYPGATASPGTDCPHPVGSTGRPFGQVDTPVQNAAGVQGAIGVTGWVLDDLGVTDLKIYRNCLPFENQAACQTVEGQSLVFVGDAAFLAGARPDLEASFPRYPYANRAGWGFLMLTNMLPNVSGSQAFGGQGPITLYVYATDAEGQRRLLGRSYLDTTPLPTSITMDNASIAKPFGAIDTPGQGVTVSGNLVNFGWALTPDADTIAGNGDILIPTNGSSMFVFLDGLATAIVNYNHCRGDVGTPPPPGVYCNDDVSQIFGNQTPQPPPPPFTNRTSNNSRHRNLDIERGAIGFYSIDTTTLSNGLHTIAWSVTDSAGRTEGIGSRFFLVLNGSADSASALTSAPAREMGDASAVAMLPVHDGRVLGRSTFDLDRPWEDVAPDARGTRHVRLPELGRIELWLGERTTNGYLVANGTLRPLPPGSRLSNGHFTWAPGAGYLGAYELAFVRDGLQIPVTVTIDPASTRGSIEGHIDDPASKTAVGGPFRVAGWAADTGAWSGAGVGAVHVWAQRVDVDGLTPVYLGSADVTGVRPDVARSLGPQFERSGWSLEAPAGLTPGTYEITAYFWATRTGRFEDARSVKVIVR